MKLLEDRIIQDGTIKPGGILKVDNFLNHQIDTGLLYEMACEWKRLYVNCDVNKILTIEASGIGLASMTGYVFGCPVLFARLTSPRTYTPLKFRPSPIRPSTMS